MITLRLMCSLILAILAIAGVLGLFFVFGIIFAKIENAISDNKHKKHQKEHPDYYQKQEIYDAKFAEASRFQLENIDNKKQEIDRLLDEIKYLPQIHTTVQLQRIEQLKAEIYENSWKHQKMVEEYTNLKEELKKLRKEYKINY